MLFIVSKGFSSLGAVTPPSPPEMALPGFTSPVTLEYTRLPVFDGGMAMLILLTRETNACTTNKYYFMSTPKIRSI